MLCWSVFVVPFSHSLLEVVLFPRLIVPWREGMGSGKLILSHAVVDSVLDFCCEFHSECVWFGTVDRSTLLQVLVALASVSHFIFVCIASTVQYAAV